MSSQKPKGEPTSKAELEMLRKENDRAEEGTG